jgi:very-short-patch-repair endonuclease
MKAYGSTLKTVEKAVLNAAFLQALRSERIPQPVAEFKFAAPDRKWAIDWAWPEHHLAVEIEGGVWAGGRHIHPTGFMKDVEKYNALALHRFFLLRFTPTQFRNLECVKWIKEWFRHTL